MTYAKGNTEYYFVSLSFAGINQFRFRGSPKNSGLSGQASPRVESKYTSELKSLSSDHISFCKSKTELTHYILTKMNWDNAQFPCPFTSSFVAHY